MNDDSFWMWPVALLLVVALVVILSVTYRYHTNDVLVSQQTTCYGKVSQQSWNNDVTAIAALQACNGQAEY